MGALHVLDLDGWGEVVPDSIAELATESLERGKVLFLPRLRFEILPGEIHLLSPGFADGKAKNISFDPIRAELRGSAAGAEGRQQLTTLMSRFGKSARELLERLAPRYRGALQVGRTSFRPVEIRGRESSYRKDDTRLHVDAFPSTPVQNKRILRVFSNVNPDGAERVWRVGADFEGMAKHFLPKMRKQVWGESAILRIAKVTKSRRTPYDHCMLQLHNLMKQDSGYQATAEQTETRFPAGSTWLMFSDQVSHAAMSGQHCLEQTFYLPVNAMADPVRSPLRILERLFGASLI